MYALGRCCRVYLGIRHLLYLTKVFVSFCSNVVQIVSTKTNQPRIACCWIKNAPWPIASLLPDQLAVCAFCLWSFCHLLEKSWKRRNGNSWQIRQVVCHRVDVDFFSLIRSILVRTNNKLQFFSVFVHFFWKLCDCESLWWYCGTNLIFC